LRIGVEGRIGDALHTLAKNRSDVPSSLRIGSTTSGVTYSIPHGLLKPDSPVQTFDGEAGRSVLQLRHEAMKVPGDATTPITAALVNALSGQFLDS
jgi:hypothetical protein